jgi:hypothetical protein
MSSADSPDLYEPDNWDDIRSPALALNTGTTNPPSLGLFKDNTEGLVDKSLQFNGADDWMSLPSAGDYTTGVGASMTWTMWIKPDVTQTSNQVPLFAKEGKWSIQLKKVGPSTFLQLYIDDVNVAQASAPLLMGQRNLIMFQLDDAAGTTCCYRIKLNNVLVVDYTDGVVDANAAIRFARGFLISSYFKGLIDEVTAYLGLAVDDATVSAAIWNGGLGVTIPPVGTGITLVSHWSCDEVATNTTPDTETVQAMILGDGAGAQAPDLIDGGLVVTSTTRGVYTLFFAPGETQEALVACQLPHGYKLGTELRPHVHWAPTDNGVGDVVWGLEYTIQVANAVFDATTTSEVTKASPAEAYHHEISAFDAIPGLGSTAVNPTSAMLMGRIYRKGDDAADTYASAVALLEFDIHYQANKAGTQIEYGPN